MHAFAHLLGEGCDDAALGRHKRGAAEVVFGLLQRSFATANGILCTAHAFVGAGQVRVGREVGRLGLVVFRLGDDLLGQQRFCALESLFCSQLVGLTLGHLSTCGGEVGFGAVQTGFGTEQRCVVDVGVELDQQVAFRNDVAFFDGELGDLAVDFGRDFDLDLRLNLSARTHALHNGPAGNLLRADLRQRAASTFDHRDHHEQNDKGTKAEEQFVIHDQRLRGRPR